VLPSNTTRQWLLAAGVLLVAASPTAAYTPRVNYQLQCMGCHHGDGAGENGRVPDMRTTVVPFSALSEGRDYILRVPGVAQAPLSDGEIAALLNWIARTLSTVPVPADFRDYTEAEVAASRHQPLTSVKQRRAELLGRINP
jgi:mono/diheme cytochrome c family protein